MTDRLAYLNYVHGALSGTLSEQLDQARSPLKTFRNAETNLGPKRTQREVVQTQIRRIEHDQARGMEKRLSDLRAQLKILDSEGEAGERESEILKRKAVAESERKKWAALREVNHSCCMSKTMQG